MKEVSRAIDDLQAYRAMLVTERRRLVAVGVHGNKHAVSVPGAPHEAAVGPSTARSAEVRALQDDIDAVNRALQDERDTQAHGGTETSEAEAGHFVAEDRLASEASE